MAFKKDKEISFEKKENGIRSIIEEKGNMALIMQEIAWNGRQAHLEIRKWIIDETGEKAHKGFSFMTEEGPHVLTNELVKNGFGNTKELLTSLKERDNFETSLVEVIGKQKVIESKNKEVEISEDDFFDPKNMF